MPQNPGASFTYFGGAAAWRPVLVSLVRLILGTLMGAFMFAKQINRCVRARVGSDEVVPGVTRVRRAPSTRR